MTELFFSLPAIFLYLITWVLVFRFVQATITNSNNKVASKRTYFLVWLTALALHALSLHLPLYLGDPLTLNFFSLASYVMWFLTLILFIITLRRRVESLAIIILPFTIISIIPTLFAGPDAQTAINLKSGLGAHILSSLLAYSMLMLASFQAVLLAYQNKLLHRHQTKGFILTLPSLEDMEHLLFRFIEIGLILLSVGLIIGFYYLENLFGSHVAHKTILSVIAWFIFTALLLGRWKYGWRGKTAVRWTLSGFAMLMLAFFGTRFIQEFVIT